LLQKTKKTEVLLKVFLKMEQNVNFLEINKIINTKAHSNLSVTIRKATNEKTKTETK
jgi:hypothetical protein